MSEGSIIKLVLREIDELPKAARAILDAAAGRRIFALNAEMGAGKTTLIKELCRQLGSNDHFSSPTFSIVNEYTSPSGKIYHIDLYRLKNIEEALAVGIEDYISGENYCFIEWPELIERLLPDDAVKIAIEVDGDQRNLSIFNN